VQLPLEIRLNRDRVGIWCDSHTECLLYLFHCSLLVLQLTTV